MATKTAGPNALRVSPRSSEEASASAADKGKSAEQLVRKWLDALARQQQNAIYRLPDARAGSRLPTLADFMMLHKGEFFLFEVKEVAHEYRVNHSNFDVGQVARMRRFAMAGATCYVLVRHSTTGHWRRVPLEFFHVREGGSWNVSEFSTRTLDNIFGGFLL